MRSREEIQKEIEFNQRLQLETAQERSRASRSGITRIGDRDGQTGRWQALTARGVREGVKTFNTSVAAGTLVRGIPTSGGAIALDRENIIGTPPPSLLVTPISWVRVWVTEQTFSAGHSNYLITKVAYVQLQGKSKIVLVADTQDAAQDLTTSQETINLSIEGVSVLGADSIFIELGLLRIRGLRGEVGIGAFRRFSLRYLVRADQVTQLPSISYGYTSSDLPNPPTPQLPPVLSGYEDYAIRDPFGATSSLPLEQQIYPQPKRYHAYFAKELFYSGSYALPPRGVGRRINELTETVKGSGRGAKYYAWAIKVAPSKVPEYARRSPGGEDFWNKVSGVWGGKIPASLGSQIRAGAEPGAIAPLTGLSGEDKIGDRSELTFLSRQRDSSILEVYEIPASIPPSYASSTTPLPFYAIPGFAKKIGQTVIDFSDSTFAEVYTSAASDLGTEIFDFFRTRQLVIKAIV